MHKKHMPGRIFALLLAAALLFALPGLSAAGDVLPAATPTPEATPVPEPTPTATPAPTPTPEPAPAPQSVTAFADLGEAATLTAQPGTAAASLPLPTQLTATVDGQEAAIEGVTWSCESYDPHTPGAYAFTAVLPEGYALADGAELPTLTVTVPGGMTPQAMSPQAGYNVGVASPDGVASFADLEALRLADIQWADGDVVNLYADDATLSGELNITANVAIQSAGGASRTVTMAVGGKRHFIIKGSATTVTFRGLTLQGPSALSGSDANGGVQSLVGGTLAFENCTLQGNFNYDPSGYGGAVLTGGNVTMTDCSVLGNSAAHGGGISADGTATLTRCTIRGNNATDSGGGLRAGAARLTGCTFFANSSVGDGGGVHAASATLEGCILSGNIAGADGGGIRADTATLDACTLWGNTAAGNGGGARAAQAAGLTNCTVAGNTAQGGTGGGLDTSVGAIPIVNCTFSGNTAGSGGGGLDVTALDLKGSIVAGNYLANGDPSETYAAGSRNNGTGTLDANFNIIGVPGSGTLADLQTLVSAATGANGKPAGLLAGNGGPTPTILPAATGIAAGAIPADTPWLPEADQRGVTRPVAGNATVGAVELITDPSHLLVTNPDDDGPGSLRQAIVTANGMGGGVVVTFDPATDGTPIQLESNLPNLTANVILRGNGADKTVVLARVGYYHLFVSGGVSAQFEGMTFLGPDTLQPQGGWSGSVRGAAGSTMTFTSCAVRDTAVGYYNGGAVDTAGTLLMTDCEVSGNRSQFGDGGGVAADTLTLINCTVSRNQGGSQGGGVAARTSATLISCTVTGNVAHDAGSAGGVGSAGSLNMNFTIVSGNYISDASGTRAEVGNGGVQNGDGTVTNTFGSRNIIGVPGAGTLADLQTILQAEAADLNGTTYNMGKLANNGGTTRTVMPAVGSSALDAIPTPAYENLLSPTPTTDQRGYSRPDASDADFVDIGAVEAQQLVSIAITSPPATLNTGQAHTLACAPTPASPEAWDGVVTWSSSAPSVLAVDAATGALTPLAPGAATITATTSGGKADSAAITVLRPVTGVTVTPATLLMVPGEEEPLTAAVLPADASNKAVAWSSSDPAVASVDGQGRVTAHALGTATITATADGGRTATCAVTVMAVRYAFTAPFPTITDNTVPASGTANGPFAGFTGLLVDGARLTQGTHFTVADGSTVITLLPAFLQTLPNGPHTVLALYTDGGAQTTLEVNIPDNPAIAVTGITVTPAQAGVAVGGTVQLTATVAPANATNAAVTWTSSDPTVATVDANGLVAGVKAGTATITATTADGAFATTSVVTVTSAAPVPPATGSGSASAATDDSSAPWLWLAIAILGGGTAIAAVRRRARSRQVRP